MSGIISDTTGNANSLTIAGSGTITFGGANTYTGTTTIYTGSLTLKNAGALASTNITLGAGTTLTLDNVSGASSNNRLSTSTSFNSSGGNIIFAGHATTQSAGTLRVLSGATLISATDAGGGSSLTFGTARYCEHYPRLGWNGTLRGRVRHHDQLAEPHGIAGRRVDQQHHRRLGLCWHRVADRRQREFRNLDANSHVVPFTNYAQLIANSSGQVSISRTAHRYK